MHLNLKEKAPPLSSKVGELGGGLQQECQSSDAFHQYFRPMVILMVNDFKLDPWAWLRMSMVLIVLPHTFLILCSL